MSDPFDTMPTTIRDDKTLGDWLYAHFLEMYGEETEAWAKDRIARISRSLNRVRVDCPVSGACPYPLHVHILWASTANAFAVPGRYVYITRDLLQRFGSDDPVAFILAHEMAHHDLGHVQLTHPLISKLRFLKGNLLIIALLKALEATYKTAGRETAADSYALDLCIAAGYNPQGFREAFDILEAELLDFRAIDDVFGEFRHKNRHPPVLHRRAALERQLATVYGT